MGKRKPRRWCEEFEQPCDMRFADCGTCPCKSFRDYKISKGHWQGELLPQEEKELIARVLIRMWQREGIL